MIQVAYDGAGRFTITTDDAAELELVRKMLEGSSAITLNAETVGELVRLAASNPSAMPQDDARALLEGRRPR